MCVGMCIVGVFASVPLFVSYLMPRHDIYFHLMRIEGLADALQAGEFPVKMQYSWLNGYGYPASIMYGDILLYLPACLRLIGFTLQDAYKIYMFLMNAMTIGVAYYAVKTMTDSRKCGLFASLLYTWASYRIVNMYYRNAVGEYSAMAFLPLVFLGLHLMIERKEHKKGALCMAVGYTMVLQTHLLTFEMTIVFSVLYCLLHVKSFVKNIVPLVKTALCTIVLNLGFLVPLLDYMITHDLKIEQEMATGHIMQEQGLFIAQFFQMLSFGGLASYGVQEGVAADMPYGVGIPLMLVLMLFVGVLFIYGRQIKESVGGVSWKEQICTCVLMVLALWMSCYFFPWKQLQTVPLAGDILTVYQFAWRFLAVATVLGVFLAGFLIKDLRIVGTKEVNATIVAGICVIALVNLSSLTDLLLTGSEQEIIMADARINTTSAVVNGEYLLAGTETSQTVYIDPHAGEGVEILGLTKEDENYVVSCNNPSWEESWVTVPVFAYKGYVAEDVESGQRFEIQTGENNVVKIVLPAGYAGSIKVSFEQPAVWRVAELLSAVMVIAMIFYGCDGSRYVCRIVKKEK